MEIQNTAVQTEDDKSLGEKIEKNKMSFIVIVLSNFVENK